jgi:hypothetical protein
MKKVFSFDAETDGLWGNPFAIAATVTSPDGVEVASFSRRLPNEAVTNQWVKENVLPNIQDIAMVGAGFSDLPISEDQYRADLTQWYEKMLREFSKFYMEHKEDAVVIAHCPNPVEAHLLREMHRIGAIGDWDGPFPLFGIEGLLDAANEPTTEATGYATKHGLPFPEGSAHNPLFDCRLATTMYRHLKGW